ncbi:MAG: TRAP transporter large permease [Burkholderiaceae bacterium]|nr:TRAP transporter large permease [Burkholderiaceae bacterium]
MTILLCVLLLVVLLLLGMPIAFAMGLSGAAGLWAVGGFDTMMGILSAAPYRNTASWLMTSLPLFVLMAEVLSASRLSGAMFDAANKWVGHLPGGLAVATVLTSAGFGAVCGSSTAATATMARTAVPEGRRLGYDAGLITGTVAASGTLSILIPPSLILVIYGILTENSIGSLFVAGIVPGIATALAYALTILIVIKHRPHYAPGAGSQRTTWVERWASLRQLWPIVLLFAAVIGSLYSGVITVTEVAAVGAAGAILIAGPLLRRLSWAGFLEALRKTTHTTAMIFAIIIGAHILSYFLTMTMATQTLVGFVAEQQWPAGAVLAVLLLIYLLLGCVMDQLAIMVLTIPIVYPLVTKLGYDPIWFGIIITKTVEIGLITPPFGMNGFVASSIAGVPLRQVFRGLMPFVLAELLLLAFFAAVPASITWVVR